MIEIRQEANDLVEEIRLVRNKILIKLKVDGRF